MKSNLLLPPPPKQQLQKSDSILIHCYSFFPTHIQPPGPCVLIGYIEGNAVRNTEGLILTIAASRSPNSWGGVEEGGGEKDECIECITSLRTSLL